MPSSGIRLAITVKVENLSMDIRKEVKKYNLNKYTEIKIINAFMKGRIDSFGRLIFPKDSLVMLLGLQKKNTVDYIFETLKNEDIVEISGKEFIDSAELSKIITKRRRRKVHKQNFKTIWEVLHKMEGDAVVRDACTAYQEQINEALSKMKDARIKAKKITKDELTGKPLKKPEFHHIRAKGLYGNEKYQLDIELGLIINNDIHKEITKNGIDNEEKLYQYAIKLKYNIDWYIPVKKELKKYK